jgi:acyl carrier protein
MYHEQILEVLIQIRPDADFISSSDFIRDGLLDSFDVVTLVSSLESKLDVEIPGDEVLSSNFSSVEAIEKMIVKKAKSK